MPGSDDLHHHLPEDSATAPLEPVELVPSNRFIVESWTAESGKMRQEKPSRVGRKDIVLRFLCPSTKHGSLP